MNFGRQFRHGTFITLISQLFKVFIGLFITAILSRLLSAEEYGIVAIVFVFLNFFDLLSQMGLGIGIIQYKNLSDTELSFLHIFSIGISICMSLLFILISPLIVKFYHEPLYYKLIPVLSINLILTGYRLVPEALLRKNFCFKKLNFFLLFSESIGGISAVILAYQGWGVYSLIFKNIITNTLLIILEHFKREFKFEWNLKFRGLKNLYSFSFYQFIYNIINYISNNLDNLLIGKYFNVYQLGIYDRAYKLAKYPLDNIKGVLSNVLYPLLSQYQNQREKLHSLYLQALKLILILFIPASAIILVMSKDIIYILYGPGWYDASTILQILASTIWVQIVTILGGIYLQSISRTDLLVKTGIYSNACMVTGILLGLFWGAKGVAVGYTVSYYIGFILSFKLIYKTMNKSFKEFGSLLILPILISICFTMIVINLQLIIQNPFLRFAIQGIIVIILYLLLIKKLLSMEAFKDILH